MSQKKSREQRQQVRRERGVTNKVEKTTYNVKKYPLLEILKAGEKPLEVATNVCTGLRGAYRAAKKGV